MIALEDDAAEDVFGQLDVALDLPDRRGGRGKQAQEIGAALVAADFVGELALVPFFEDEDFAAVGFDELADGLLGGLRFGRGGAAEEEHPFVLIGLDCFFGLLLSHSVCSLAWVLTGWGRPLNQRMKDEG
jgi:hypothetical protein